MTIDFILSDWLYIWLAVIIVTAAVEIATVGLTSIWVTGGALAALIVCLLGGHPALQVVVFFVVTFLLLYYTRPWAKKYLESKKVATNYEECIGKEVRVVEAVDNRLGTGKVIYNGMEWMARALEDDVTFAVEEQAQVAEIRGVKMMLDKITEEPLEASEA